MENEQIQKYQNFISAQNFPEDPKNTRIRIKYDRHTYHFAMEIQPPGGGGDTNYSIHMQKLCFLYDEKAVPASRSLGRQKKMESPTFGKTALIIRRKSLTLKPIFTQGISEKLLKNGKHKSPPRHAFMWRLA